MSEFESVRTSAQSTRRRVCVTPVAATGSPIDHTCEVFAPRAEREAEAPLNEECEMARVERRGTWGDVYWIPASVKGFDLEAMSPAERDRCAIFLRAKLDATAPEFFRWRSACDNFGE